MSDQGMVRRWAGERPKLPPLGELACGAVALYDGKFKCVLALGHKGPHKSDVGVKTELGSTESVHATWISRDDGSEVGERRAVIDGRIKSATATGSGGWGSGPSEKKAKPEKYLDTEAKLMRSHRRKQAESRADKKRKAALRAKPPSPSQFCDAPEYDGQGVGRVCELPPDHDGDHKSGPMTWPQRAAEQLVPCPAEDARGFACSKVAGHDGDHHNVRGWEPEDPEADAAAQAALDAEEDRRASRWHCEAPFIGTDGREYKCEDRDGHNGSHYAWSAGAKVTIYARAEQPPAKFKQYGFVLQVSDGAVLCHDGEFRQLSNPVSALSFEERPHAFATKQRAGSQAHWLERATTTVPYFVDEAGHQARVGDATATEEKTTMETIETETAPRSNGATKHEVPKKGRRIESIARNKIEPNPNQPRKTFNEEKLHELAASIEVHGIEQPLIVRPRSDRPGEFIIIMGERRWRAAGIAGLTEVPCIIDDREHDAVELLERQLVENEQRDDLNPIEEGEALATLHYKHGKPIEDLVSKTGKSRSHVYSRIALTKLAPGVKKAIGDGRLPHAHGGLIGTIPDAKAQEQCCKEVLGELAPQGLRALEDIGVSHESVTDDGSRRIYHNDGKPQVLSFRATAALIRRRYQTRLQLATFDPNDATLTSAGACGSCSFNSANQPELPGIAATTKPESHCGNLTCFEKKTQAQFKRKADAAKAEGKKVIEGKKAEQMFSHNGELKSETGYAAPDQRLPWNLVNSYDDKFTFKKMLGKHISEVPTAIVQDERGAAIEVLDIDKAVEVLKEHKLLPKKGSSSSSAKPTAAEKRAKEKAKEEKAAEKLREEAYQVLINTAMSAAETLPAEKEAAMWRWVALALVTDCHYTERTMFSERRGADFDEGPEKALQAAKTPGAIRAVIVEMLMCKMADSVINEDDTTDEAMDLAKRLFGLDWKKAEKLALVGREQKKVNEALAKQAEEAKAAKKKGGRK